MSCHVLELRIPDSKFMKKIFLVLNLILESRREIFIIQYKAYNSMNNESSDHCSKSLRLMLIFLPNCSFIICKQKKSDGFLGISIRFVSFADNPQNPVTDDEEQESTKNKTLNILYSCFLFYLIPTSVTCYKCRNKIQESNNKNLFF